MIGFLKGKVIKRWSANLIVEVNGVGYQVQTPPDVWEIATEGNTVILFITTIVRQDQLYLVGFLSLANKILFECLIKVSGVGPRLAMQLISALGTAGVRRAIDNKDLALLAKAPGVGKKIAQRMCLELHDQLPPQIESGDTQQTESGDTQQMLLISALTNLGFLEKDIHRVVHSLSPQLKGFDARLKEALQQLHPPSKY